METLKKQRTVLRRLYSESEKKLRRAIDEVSPNLNQLYLLCKDKAEALSRIDDKIKDQWFVEESASEDEICADLQANDTYRLSWLDLSSEYDKTQQKLAPASVCGEETVRSYISADQQRRLQLPKIELRKFDGSVKNWISFWGQFEKIHMDTSIDTVDKFQYLVQATEENSKARALVDSYPPSAENYMKPITELKERFARDDLLIMYYIRSLLQLVDSNKSGYLSLQELYDKLSTQLQALESLKVTKDNYAAMLLPMVESAIPRDVLKAWERSKHDKVVGEDLLSDLLRFMKREVESEERINASRDCFETTTSYNSKAQEPTAACILTHEKNKNKTDKACVWCNKTTHTNIECYKPTNLTLDEKKDILRKSNCCFICLKEGHSSKRCRNFPKCLLCGKRHVVLLCPSLPETKKTENNNNANTNTMICTKGVTTILQTVLVSVMYENKKIVTRALLDSGAQRSYIKQDIAMQLGMRPCSSETVSHCLFGGVEMRNNVYKTYKFNLQSYDGKFDIKISALEQKQISGFLPRLSSLNVDIVNKLNSLNIVVSDIGDEPSDVGLLIGADISGYLLTGKIVGLGGNFVAIETRLGWCVQGSLPTHSYTLTHVYSTNFTLTDLWNFETIGIRDPAETLSKCMQNNQIAQFFRDTVERDGDGRYKVALPWKPGFPEQLDETNKALSWKRLQSTTKKLEATGNIQRYNQVFVDWEIEGIIERVPNNNNGFYLPHHAVIKESSETTPVRPVFDASAKNSLGMSLNSCLNKGENLIEFIPKLLLQFRRGSIGIISDIRKAFLQISLSEKDRDFLQFLWWDDFNTKRDVITYRHKRVVFGVTCSPFLLAATLNLHLDSYSHNNERSKIANKLKSSFYVDNCVTSVDTQQECDNFIKMAKEILQEGMFELRGWITGPSNVIGNPVSVLGLMWDSNKDTLCISFKQDDIDLQRVTKRLLLSFAQRIFDPIGYSSPVTLIPKLLLQRCWQLKLDWDSEVPEVIKKEYLCWADRLKSLAGCCIPRRLSMYPMDSSKISIHTFCDACKFSYAACVFLRCEFNGQVHTQLMLAKSRVAPLRDVSVPRLELISAVIGVRLFSQVVASMDSLTYDSYFWTDSTVAVTWIRKESHHRPVFVNNRVKEILSVTNRKQWHHISGTCNPADLPSRGCYADKLSSSKWWEGPLWLRLPQSQWPMNVYVESDFTSVEVQNECVNNVNIVERDSGCNIRFSDRLIYFSKYSKIIRCVGWIYRFFRNCKQIVKVEGELSFEEYTAAEINLLKLIQRESFTDSSIKSIKNLVLFCSSDGVWKVQTRLLLGNEPENFKYPILLPGCHEICKRLIYHVHHQLQHAGTALVICCLRENYWITAARKSVQNVISACRVCKRYRSKAVQVPVSQLPENRIKLGKVFEIVGIDLAGPLLLRSGQKVWIILFTCAIYRAVHIELTLSLNTESFIMALRRFISRRGRMSTIYTDNGTNFVGTANLLKQLDWSEIQLQSTILQIQWIFNAPSAPWWGGFWERLIRILKDLIRKVLGRASLSYVELETLLCDCESTLNSRPLTYVTENDSLIPITPNCFLRELSGGEVSDIDHIDAKALNVRIKYLQTLRSNLKQRFRSEYLGQLVQRKTTKQGAPKLKIGDVVLVETEQRRQLWPLGVVTNVILGRDGHARVAQLKVNGTILTRPLQRLYPLEVANASEEQLPALARTRLGRIVKKPNRF